MSTAIRLSEFERSEPAPTLAAVLKHIPNVPHERICMNPLPGTATEQDAIESKDRLGFICELINGTLVRKTVGWYESAVAAEIIARLILFLRTHKLGKVSGADGPTQLKKGVLKYPDVAFFSWERLRKSPISRSTAAAKVGPDLAIEVLSPGNTKAEMDEKLRDYFTAKVRMVWYIDSRTKTAQAWRSLRRREEIPADGELDGGDVLPGFRLDLADLFASVEEIL
jgi:Uma2 family endonuclease